MASINDVASKGSNKSNINNNSLGDTYNKAVENLRGRVENIANARFKNDPKKAQEYITKLMKQFSKNALEIQNYERKSKKELIKEENDNKREIAKMEMASAKTNSQFMKASFKEAAANFSDYLQENLSLSAITEKVGAQIDAYADIYSKYTSSINARLQTFDKYQGEAFKDLSKIVRKNLAASPYIKQEEMLTSLNTLVEKGISYNLEQRAFLATVTDKIVTTFNALDETLLAMVRLQQQDTTQARMGMEAQLTKYLNSTYEDSSYLDNVYDTVTQNLFEASSQLGRNASIELEYVVQKWLGSMYSVGVGSSFLQSIAQGLGYLGSGDIDSLQSNAALQNLLVMASNRSGVEYSQILTQGLNADTANKLLSGIASYVHEISQSNNQVVKSQYAQIFGMTLSDMTAMLNLSSKDLLSISQNMLSYGDTIKELNSQLSSVGSRMHVKELMDNVFDNFMAGVAGNIAGSTGQYITWKVVDLVEKATGGIQIPAISVLGNMIDLDTTITGLMKTGIVGMNVIGQIANIIGGLTNGGSLSLNNWTGNESTARGTGFAGITGYTGSSTTTSTSAFIGSSSSSDIYSSSVTAAKDKAREENKGEEEQEDIMDLTKIIIQFLTDWSNGTRTVYAKVTEPIDINNYGLTTSGI